MAYSASTGFRLRKSLYGIEQPAVVQFKVNDSETLTIGDVVRVDADGLVTLAGAGAPVLGVVVGLVDSKGINPFSLSYSNGTGATLSGDDTIVSASDNSTRAEFINAEVIIDPAGSLLFYNDADGALAQANLGQLFDVVAASDQIDQSSASDTSGQFQLLGLDPNEDSDASTGLFRIAETQLITQVGNSTAVISA